jgi:2-amino-4-hydroxy-6-hydroxymethyldihydropteridine diphosphokinase
MSVCLVSLGSNLGNRQENLDAAVARLAAHPQIRLLATSRWRETSPVGGPADQGSFLNGALKLETSLAPQEMLSLLQQIENGLDRQRTERWGPRTIDLDVLLHDDLVVNTPTLVIPHPRMAWRRFVLEPAAEIAGPMIHPTIRWSVARLLRHINDSLPYLAITGPIAAGKSRLAERLADAIAEKKRADPICRNGPEGASHKMYLTPLSPLLILEEPDWTRLDAFYADPPDHAWQTEMAFLDERKEKLSDERLRQATFSRFSWVVSDFWFDQSAAFARAWLPAERLAEYRELFERLRQTVAVPRLIVLLDAPADILLARIRQRGRPCERHLTVEALERIRQAVLEEVDRPGLGPLLRASSDPEAAFAEVLAAVHGME